MPHDNSTPRAIQRFEVSLKAAIIRDGRLLLLREADTGYWELPGGRIDVGEERKAQHDVLVREIAEELGASVQVTVDAMAVTWVRQRLIDGIYQLIVARPCWFIAGTIALSAEHADARWTTPHDWPGLTFPPLSDYHDGLQRLWSAIGTIPHRSR